MQLLTFNNKGYPKLDLTTKSLPSVSQTDRVAHPLLYFIDRTLMGDNPMVRFVDALGRHGVAWQYDYCYRSPYIFEDKTKPFIDEESAVLHQLILATRTGYGFGYTI